MANKEKTPLDKLKEIEEPAPTDWKKLAEKRICNRKFLRLKGYIQTRMLTVLDKLPDAGWEPDCSTIEKKTESIEILHNYGRFMELEQLEEYIEELEKKFKEE